MSTQRRRPVGCRRVQRPPRPERLPATGHRAVGARRGAVRRHRLADRRPRRPPRAAPGDAGRDRRRDRGLRGDRPHAGVAGGGRRRAVRAGRARSSGATRSRRALASCAWPSPARPSSSPSPPRRRPPRRLVFDALGPIGEGGPSPSSAPTEAGAAIGLFAVAVALVVAVRLGSIPFHLRVPRLTDVAPPISLPLLLAWIPVPLGVAAIAIVDRQLAPLALPLDGEQALIVLLALADAGRGRAGGVHLRRPAPRDRLPRDRRRRPGAAGLRGARSGGLGPDAGLAGRAGGLEDGGRGMVGGDGGPVPDAGDPGPPRLAAPLADPGRGADGRRDRDLRAARLGRLPGAGRPRRALGQRHRVADRARRARDAADLSPAAVPRHRPGDEPRPRRRARAGTNPEAPGVAAGHAGRGSSRRPAPGPPTPRPMPRRRSRVRRSTVRGATVPAVGPAARDRPLAGRAARGRAWRGPGPRRARSRRRWPGEPPRRCGATEPSCWPRPSSPSRCSRPSRRGARSTSAARRARRHRSCRDPRRTEPGVAPANLSAAVIARGGRRRPTPPGRAPSGRSRARS